MVVNECILKSMKLYDCIRLYVKTYRYIGANMTKYESI